MIITVTLNPSLDEWVYLPRLYLGVLNRAVSYARYPGGKGLNVSRVVRELGASSLAVAVAGGADGRILHTLLQQQHVPHRFISVLGETRNNYHIQTDIPRTLTQLNSPGPRISVRALRQVEAAVSRAVQHNAVVVYSGSLPPGAPASVYARLIRAATRQQVLSVLDTSGAALRAGLAAKPWLLKPNRAEAEEVLGRRIPRASDAIRAARQLARRGPAHVLLSLGKDGALLASRGQTQVWWASAPHVPVRSGVGAGDAMVAGFVVGWQRTDSLVEALRLAIACGTACVMTPGTELARAEDIRRLVRRVRIRTAGSA